MSARKKTQTRARPARRIHGHPMLSDFHAPLPRLTEPGEKNLGVTFARLAERIGSSPDAPSARFHISEGKHVTCWFLDAGPVGCRVTDSAEGPSDLEIFLDADTWRQMACGRLSPLEAFSHGRLRLRVSSDLDVARRFVRRLHSTVPPRP
jgi:SCP-2 sterol transfer family